MKLKKTARTIHNWLGILSALILFFVCLSGSLFVYSDNILDHFHKKAILVEEQGNTISIDRIIQDLKEEYPNHFLISLIDYKEKTKALKFLIASRQTGLCHVFVNPYNGEIISESKLISFVSLIAHFHKELLLGKIGVWIVRIASIIFLIELISGLILIVPKNKKKLKNVFTIKKGAPFLRKMFDWHKVLGIYPIAILLLLSLTGIIIAFSPKYGIEAEHKKNHNKENKYTSANIETREPIALASLLPKYFNQQDVNEIKVELWNINTAPYYQIITGEKIGVLTYTGNVHIIDKYTGAEQINNTRLHKLNINNIMRKLHVGDWCGALGKAITFLGGLAGAVLALTGCIIWWKKRF